MYEGSWDLQLDVFFIFSVSHPYLVVLFIRVPWPNLQVGFLVEIHEDFALLFQGLFVFELAFSNIGFEVDSWVTLAFESGFE